VFTRPRHWFLSQARRIQFLQPVYSGTKPVGSRFNASIVYSRAARFESRLEHRQIEVPCGFPQSLQSNVRMVPWNSSRPLHSTSFELYLFINYLTIRSYIIWVNGIIGK
jgi:hypothetical protein